MRQKAPEPVVLMDLRDEGGERVCWLLAEVAVRPSSKGGDTGVMWRVMTRRNERNWFLPKHAAGARHWCRGSLHKRGWPGFRLWRPGTALPTTV